MKEPRGSITHLLSKPLSSGEVGSKTKVKAEESMGEDVHSVKIMPEIAKQMVQESEKDRAEGWRAP